jgi:hypothetical protein
MSDQMKNYPLTIVHVHTTKKICGKESTEVVARFFRNFFLAIAIFRLDNEFKCCFSRSTYFGILGGVCPPKKTMNRMSFFKKFYFGCPLENIYRDVFGKG